MPKAQKTEFEIAFETTLAEYAIRYDVDALDSPNDIANLHTMVRNQIVIGEIQKNMHRLAAEDAVGNINTIKNLNISLASMSETTLALERALALDRKTRQGKSETSVATYIAQLKQNASAFLDQQLIRVVCPSCKILLGRIASVHEHTAYTCTFQCSQCKKQVIAERVERDVFFDIKDSDWRKRYPVEITPPKATKARTYDSAVDEDDTVYLESEDTGIEGSYE